MRLRSVPTAVWLFAVAYAAQFAALCSVLIWRYVDADALVDADMAYWYAHGVVKEPCFFGQTYNWPLESWLAVPLVWAGVRADAATMAVAAFSVYGFFLSAVWLLRKAPVWIQGAVGVTPLAVPLKLMVAALLARNFGTESAVAGMCALAVIASQRRRVTMPAAFAIGACAASYTPALTAAICIVLVHRRWRRTVEHSVALALGFAAVASLGLFYTVHPDYVVRRIPATGLSIDNLLTAIRHQHVLVATALAALLTAALVCAVACLPKDRGGRGRLGLALVAVGGVVTAMLGTARVHRYEPTPFYSVWRYWVPLMMVGVIVVVWSHRRGAPLGPRRPMAVTAVVTSTALLAAAGITLQVRDVAVRAPHWAALDPGVHNYIQDRAALGRECHRLRQQVDPATQYVQLAGPAVPQLAYPYACHWMADLIVVDRYKEIRTWLVPYARQRGLTPLTVQVDQ